jgi:hypothetical protein
MNNAGITLSYGDNVKLNSSRYIDSKYMSDDIVDHDFNKKTQGDEENPQETERLY